MSVVCPAGHTSDSTDYCDVCGLAIPAGAATAPPVPADGGSAPSPLVPPPGVSAPAPAKDTAAAPAGKECPHCGAANANAALFCEVCGYDFTTGSLPAAPAPVTPNPDALVTTPPAGVATTAPGEVSPWVVEVWVDPDWYASQDVAEPCPSGGPPTEITLNVRSALVGRYSASRGISPQVDVGADSGVSRRHCQLTTDGTRWWVEDLQSSNGTYVGPPGASSLPTDPIVPGQRRELADGDRVYLGAWTRLVVRRGA